MLTKEDLKRIYRLIKNKDIVDTSKDVDEAINLIFPKPLNK